MRKICTYFLGLGLLLSQPAFTQRTIQFKTGKVMPQSVTDANLAQLWKQQSPVLGKRFMLLQFKQPITEAIRKQLVQEGILLSDYIPPMTYYASFNKEISKNTLQQSGIIGIAHLPATLKISAALQYPEKHQWLQGIGGSVEVLVKVSKVVELAAAEQYLKDKGFPVLPSDFRSYGIIQSRLALGDMVKLAEIAFVEYIEPVHPKDSPLNEETRYMSRANIAIAPLAAGGYNLSGNGVVVGIGDDGDPTNHVDIKDRVINRSAYIYNNHGTHVTGTVGGGGISRYLSRGYAPQATIISQIYGGIYNNAAQYVNDYGMTVTNNSYGSIMNDPTYEGVYDLYSVILDQQAFQFPELLHVFAAGNDGNVVIPAYPLHYANVLSGYQSAKNVITVGRLEKNIYAGISSSGGPVRDGRLKPEIMSLGKDLISCIANGSYAPSSGTSMAAPGVTGGIALLTEQYKNQFATNPKSGLMKTLVMNGGMDVGATGPDFRHGYGVLNLNRSLDMLQNSHFYTGTATTGSLQTQMITVPANTAQLKVMLYWHDPAAAVYAAHTLVNDLDLEVVDAMANVVYPQKLDTIPANVADTASTGADHINNNEQVIIDNPSGTYTIRVKGTAINVNPSQEYFVAYDYLPQGLHLSVPFEKNTYWPGEPCIVHWEDYGTPGNQRTLEYSLNDGVSWNPISATISDTARYYIWTVPSAETNNARLRITENATAFSSTSGKFVILDTVTPTLAPESEQCESYCKLNWSSISGSGDIDYEVLLKQGKDMVAVGTTTGTTFTISGLSKDSVYWMAVRPRKAGIPGRRSDGISYQPNTGDCSMGISNGDLKVDSILTPNTGRIGTSSALSASTNLSIRIKNLDDVSITGFAIKYSINGGSFISQSLGTTINAGDTLTYTFSGVDFSQPGVYNIRAVVKNNGSDPVAKNDTLSRVVKQLKNSAISLATPFIENFDAAPATENASNTMGIDSLDRWDFTSTTISGRARTFVNSGIAKSGNRAMTIDVNKYIMSGSTNQLIGTFNLTGYDATTDEVRMDVQFKKHGVFQLSNPDNKIYIRGNESSNWIELYDLSSNQPVSAGEWKKTNSINIGTALANAMPAQNFSSSTQIRIGQNSVLGMGDDLHYGGYTFDDLRLYTVTDDIAISAITAPVGNSCALTNATAVTILLKNTTQAGLFQVPVRLQIDGGSIIFDTVPSVPAAPAQTPFTFASTVDLSALGTHTIKVWSAYATDNFSDNDTIITTIVNQPVINTFPYLQDFESSNGTFYTTGTSSSWQYGTPNSLKIKTAASGTKAWKTNLQGFYNDEERSYLYFPCFNVSALTSPTLSFSMAYDLEYCRPSACDSAWLEYSTDGNTWNKLGSSGTGYNWYNNITGQVWDSAKTYWHVATVALPTGFTTLRLRFVMNSDIFTGKEGIAIDDIHVYDKQFAIYDGPSNSNTVVQAVSGTSPIDFTDAGKILATIYPEGNTMGNTAIKAYIYTGSNVRDNGQHYYGDRNIIIQPTTTVPATPVKVRLYFLDKEVDSLRIADGCGTCGNLKDYTGIGIIKYSDGDDSKENGTMADNGGGAYTYLSSTLVKKVPYDKGYYAEYNVSSFSEFWLTDTTSSAPLPADWLSFTAERIGTTGDILLQWKTTNEVDVAEYIVEVSNGSQNAFQPLGIVLAKNQSTINNYQFIHHLTEKYGVYYYRIKRVDKSGIINYSETKLLLLYDNNMHLLVYPNPAKDKTALIFQSASGSPVRIMLSDATGKCLWQQTVTATGLMQKVVIPVGSYSSGMYQLKVQMGDKEKVMKIVRE